MSLSRAQLNLGENWLGPEGAEALAPAVAVSGSLTKILVGGNQLGDEGAIILCDALRESKVTKVQELGLANNRIGPHGAKAVAAMAAFVGSVTRVDVRYNDVTGDGASQLSAAVLANTKIEVFNEVPIKEMRADSLTELDLKDKVIGVEGGMVVAGLIPVMASLTKILVGFNELGDKGATVLCDALRESTVSKVQELDLSDNMIGPDGANAIAALCTVTASLTRLNVSMNLLDRGGNGVQLLRDAVREREGFVLIDDDND